MSLLLIEDETKIVDIYTQILSNLEVNIVSVSNAEEALPLLEKIPFKLVLVDIMLPGMNGVDFVKKAQTLESYEKLTIVVLTNMGSGFDRQALLDSGVCEVLLKLDLGPKELTQLVKKYCYD